VFNDRKSLPKEFRSYWPMIKQCFAVLESPETASDVGESGRLEGVEYAPPLLELEDPARIVYLTVDERKVMPGESHRRGGLHTEAPGTKLLATDAPDSAAFADPDSGQVYPPRFHGWGTGELLNGRMFRGGLFMASTVSNTCAVYNARVKRPEVDEQGYMNPDDSTPVGLLGDCEHIRSVI
jgi:hypothetical protein